MRSFLIMNGTSEPRAVARLTYDASLIETRRWSGSALVEPGDGLLPLPFEIWCARTGSSELSCSLCRMWVRERMMPPERQLGGLVLKNLGLGFYSEPDLLAALGGASARDAFYVVEEQ